MTNQIEILREAIGDGKRYAESDWWNTNGDSGRETLEDRMAPWRDAEQALADVIIRLETREESK